MQCNNNAKNRAVCNCTYSGCQRHGVCCECIHYHRNMGELPACYFGREQERTYNRSISWFVKQNWK
ncbi:MAG: hypothetical protein EHM28_12085 [Spirochaetaceae bacterium]|nr:MAG: hypothetical protein EHM28_12085 [Spirochaetaceae bacterium]